jgi:hypothetical protein
LCSGTTSKIYAISFHFAKFALKILSTNFFQDSILQLWTPYSFTFISSDSLHKEMLVWYHALVENRMLSGDGCKLLHLQVSSAANKHGCATQIELRVEINN